MSGSACLYAGCDNNIICIDNWTRACTIYSCSTCSVRSYVAVPKNLKRRRLSHIDLPRLFFFSYILIFLPSERSVSSLKLVILSPWRRTQLDVWISAGHSKLAITNSHWFRQDIMIERSKSVSECTRISSRVAFSLLCTLRLNGALLTATAVRRVIPTHSSDGD